MLPVTTYHHGDLRGTVLRTAGKMLDEEGLESLSFREIARRAGVSHNAPYRHFHDRDTLLVALACEGFDRLSTALKDVAPSQLASVYVGFAADHPQRFRLMVQANQPAVREKSDAMLEIIGRALAEVGGTRFATVAALSLMNGLAHVVLNGSFEREQSAAGGRERFVEAVSGAVRFVVKAQRPA